MEIILEESELVIRLRPLEKLTAFRSSDIRAPRSSVRGAELSLPPSTWKQLRIAGTYLPGVIKAGSFLTESGWEFWYVTREGRDHPVQISLTDHRYARLVLGFEHDCDIERINAWSQKTLT